MTKANARKAIATKKRKLRNDQKKWKAVDRKNQAHYIRTSKSKFEVLSYDYFGRKGVYGPFKTLPRARGFLRVHEGIPVKSWKPC